MRITIVGSGDAFGSGGRFNTCFRVETSGRDLLLDCGASSLPALKAQGIDPNTIDGVMLSHLHGDHFGGVVFLVMDGHFLSRRERPLLIAGPPGTRGRLDAALEAFFPRSTTIAWRYPWRVVEIVPGTPAEFLGLSVETLEVVHQSGAPRCGFRTATGYLRIRATPSGPMRSFPSRPAPISSSSNATSTPARSPGT
jgi:ribonuclease BN (tRNA processing enzyme)